MTTHNKFIHDDLFNSWVDIFNDVTSQMSEFQKTQYEHMKHIFSVSVANHHKLSQIRDHKQLFDSWGEVSHEQRDLLTKAFLDGFEQRINMLCKLFDANALHADKLKELSSKAVDFYIQLIPNNESFEFARSIREIASGNLKSADAIKEMVKSALHNYSEQVKSSAEQALLSLKELSDKAHSK